MADRASWKTDLRHLGILTGLCLLLGVYLILTTVLIARDGVFYIRQAQQFAEYPAGVARTYPVGYPFLLWAAHQVTSALTRDDSVLLWIYSSQAVSLLCRVLALVPLYFLGKLLVGARNSFWAVLILIVLPYPAQYGSDVLREWPHVLFLGLGFWLLYWGLHRRHWWVLLLVGLDVGLGHLVRPECAQLILYALLGLAYVVWIEQGFRRLAPLGAAVLLLAGFALPAIPYACARGTIMPHLLRSSRFNAPPVIGAVGLRQSSADPLEFEVRAGELLELPIQATDPQGDAVTFTLAGAPMGSQPVYEFRSPFTGERFWTASEGEKDSLVAKYAREEWRYKGIVFYAYPQCDARPGLQLVRRFWSGTLQRHFYASQEAEFQALRRESPVQKWADEGIAFYALAADQGSPDTVPVYRVANPANTCIWELGEGPSSGPASSSGKDNRKGTVVWHVHPAGKPPAGARIEGRVFRWRPGPGQQGDYQVGIIASDGELQDCQLVRIRVDAVPRQGTNPEDGDPASEGVGLRSGTLRVQHAGVERLAEAVTQVFAGVAENLMVILFAPWVLGLYCRFRRPGDRLEQLLILALILVNVTLMVARHVNFGAGEDRRYSLGMLALTVFYIPPGLEILSRRLAAWKPPLAPRWSWFHLLVAIGILVCVPKLLKPSRVEKAGYRATAAWLRQNTNTDEVIAAPDSRICFYAQRPGIIYEESLDTKGANYLVLVCRAGGPAAPAGWQQEYASPAGGKHREVLAVYRAPHVTR
ncbi:MAG: glycosyltransferase family 39 protein [Planctomycetes bacterium]|jgi:hypothetical protein|nr:glycosyltransferase family 39 protein [Planctomycetota bacterium]